MAKPDPKIVTMGSDYDYIWDISAAVGSSKASQLQDRICNG